MELNKKLLEFEEAKQRVEKAIENFYLEYYYVQRKYLKFNFSYRIEQVSHNNEKYIRFCFSSGKDRICRYIGKLEPALRACIKLRPKLCDNALLDLVRIIEKNELPFWFYKLPLQQESRGDFSLDDYVNFEFIMNSITQKARAIKGESRAIPYDLDNFVGFFIDEYPATSIFCRPIMIEINLIDSQDFLHNLDEKIPSIFPSESKLSFDLNKNYGRYITGRFLEQPYSFYFDIVWSGEFFKVRILNITGIERKN